MTSARVTYEGGHSSHRYISYNPPEDEPQAEGPPRLEGRLIVVQMQETPFRSAFRKGALTLPKP
jgi:hypothetical protein